MSRLGQFRDGLRTLFPVTDVWAEARRGRIKLPPLDGNDVTEEKTAVSAIFTKWRIRQRRPSVKSDITEDESKQTRRLPDAGQNDQNKKSTRYWEKLFQSSYEGHLSRPKKFQGDLRTFPSRATEQNRKLIITHFFSLTSKSNLLLKKESFRERKRLTTLVKLLTELG